MINMIRIAFAFSLLFLAAPAIADEFADKLANGYQIVGFSVVDSDDAFFIIQNGADVQVCSAVQINFAEGATYEVRHCVPLRGNQG